MPQCHVCGATISDQDTICNDCGTEVPAPPSPPISPGQEPAPPQIAPSPSPVEASAPQVVPPTDASPVAPSASARLTLVRAGSPTSDVFPLGMRSTIGRFDVETGPVEVDLSALPEAHYVSRRHVQIWRDAAGTWLIKDLGSANGTFLRTADAAGYQRVVGEQSLHDGDFMALGNVQFAFAVEAPRS